MSKKRMATILSLCALVAAGCGGDDEDDVGTIPTVPLSVPGGSDTTGFDETTDTTVETVPVDPAPAPTPEPEPAPTPTPTPPAETPDTPENDTPPSGDAQQFEEFCSQNPGACE